ncbi:MAG: hypothetical protein ACKOI2_03035 [Actinomycetota bacterium]
MNNLIIGLAIAVVVGVVAIVMRRRQVLDAPTQRTYTVPSQIDRADFGVPPEEWLIVVFTSTTCPVCADVSAKALALASRHVAIRIADYSNDRAVHERYSIDAVPAVVIADSSGVVRHHFLGPVTATDLWAAVASVRDDHDPHAGECSGE